MGQINSCGAFLSSGLGDCNSRFQPIIGLIISAKNTTYTTAELATIAKTKTNVSLAAGIVSIYVPVVGLNKTTDEPQVETTPTGQKRIYRYSTPSIEIFMDRAFDDFRSMWLLNSTIVEVEFVTQDRFRFMTPISNGNWKGFRGQMFMQPDLPSFENGNEAHKISINFSDVSEWQNMEALPMNYSGSEIEALVPKGLTLRANGPYNGTSGEIILKSTKRGSAVGYAGLDTWDILDSNVANAVVTAVAGTDGTYTVTALKNTTDELVTGDYITVQGLKVVSTYGVYITTPLTIDGVTP